MSTRRQFTREFKAQAVRLVTDQGVSIAQAARDLNLHPNVLRKWIKQMEPTARMRFRAMAR